MVWFRVDDNFADHPKVRRIPRAQRTAAIGLWTLAGTWAARHLRDGVVPDYMVEELAGKLASAQALVRVDLWHASGHACDECKPIPVDSYIFHDWKSLQYTREQVLAKREADAERQRLARERKKSRAESQDRHAVTDADDSVSHGPVQLSRPVPSRPEPYTDPDMGETSPTSPRGQRDDAPPICTRHPDGNPADDPCGGCQRVRAWHEQQAERDHAEARTAAERARTRTVLAELERSRLTATPIPDDVREQLATRRRAQEAS